MDLDDGFGVHYVLSEVGEPDAQVGGPLATGRVLITGGAGYVGSVLAQELLGRGYAVRVVDTLLHADASLLPVWGRPSFEFVRG